MVWIGRDDNEPTGLTGASGALTVWGEMMARLAPEPLILPEPDNIERVWIDKATGLRSAAGCQGANRTPFCFRNRSGGGRALRPAPGEKIV